MFLTLLVALAAQPGEFVVTGPDSIRFAGRVVKLAADGSVELVAEERPITIRDAISVRRSGVPLPPLPRGPVLLTTTGDRIPLRKGDAGLLVGDDQTLRIRTSISDADWDVPVAFASLVWLVKPPAETPFDLARYSWLPANRNRDFVRFRNGDTASGTFSGFKDEAVLRLKPEAGEERVFPLEQLSAIAFNPTLARNRKVKGPYARIVLRDGTRLGLTQMVADETILKGKTLFGPSVELPLDQLVSLDVLQGKAAFLADLKPKKVEQTAFLGTTWNWMPNRSVRGEPLRIGDSTFDRGLGTHPRTVLTYDLAGKYKRFDAVVGLEGERGRATVKVLVDGKEQALPELMTLTAGAAIAVNVDLTGAKELTLMADFGSSGDVQADVNWGDARLVE
ncbi:MAG: NPCBM/NEW2 domain-containing protein [Gemmataceae bacterium]